MHGMRGAHRSQYFDPESRAALTLTQASALRSAIEGEPPPCPRLARTQSVLRRPIEASTLRTAKKHERAVTLPARRNAASLSRMHESRYRRAEDVNEEICPPRTVFSTRSDLLRISTHTRSEMNTVKSKRHGFSSYAADKLRHIECLAPDDLLNPFRGRASSHKYGISKKPILIKDFTAFGDPYNKKHYGRFTVNIRSDESSPPFSHKHLLESTLRVAQVDIQAFDMKLVETGVLIRAFQNVKLASPGIPAVFSMLRQCRHAACLNPDPWVLALFQLKRILSHQLPWLDKNSIYRLLIAHDPHRTGFIRFLRVFLPVVAYFSPLVNDYTAFVELDLHGSPYSSIYLLIGLYYDVYISLETSNDVKESRLVSSSIIEEDEDRSTMRRHFTGVRDESYPRSELNYVVKSESEGIRIADIFEALTCCSCDKLDLHSMNQLIAAALQVLFKPCDCRFSMMATNRIPAMLMLRTNQTRRSDLHPSSR